MKIAILSDIHSNAPALKAVKNEMLKFGISKVIILGDIFGYYPWAVKTYECLMTLDIIACIKGNHDEIVIEQEHEIRSKNFSYYEMARHNRKQLDKYCPEAMIWLRSLAFSGESVINNISIKFWHGTPFDPENGRLYPDDYNGLISFPESADVCLLGHTHYPLLYVKSNGCLVLNPGSVGQPRDGDIRSSWGILDTDTLGFRIIRTQYPIYQSIKELKQMNWNNRSICALKKDYLGPLKFDN